MYHGTSKEPCKEFTLHGASGMNVKFPQHSPITYMQECFTDLTGA